jgi:hypothetical protein
VIYLHILLLRDISENIVKDIPEIEMASQMLWEEEPLFTVGK